MTKQCVTLFRNLRELLAAPSEELERCGLPPQCIFYVRLLRDIPARALREKTLDLPVYTSSQDVVEYLSYSMRDLKKETCKAIYLNNRNQIIDVVDLFEGSLDSIPINPREIIESVLKLNATALIFVHNHPSGNPQSSKSDKELTRDLVFMGMILQIRVLDHIIIGNDRYFSFADEGLIKKYKGDFLNLRLKTRLKI